MQLAAELRAWACWLGRQWSQDKSVSEYEMYPFE